MEMNYVNEEHTSGEKNLSDLLLERLMARGVDTIFGMPGDGVNGLVEALRKKQKQIRYIHVRHEEIGALAVVAYAKLTGKIGVCFGTMLPADFVKIAEDCGIKGIRIDDPTHCYEQLQQALAMQEPVLIECEIDPNEPALETPLPEEHAENYKKALEKTTYKKEESERELAKNLQHQKEIIRESMNKKSEELMNDLQKK